MNRISFLLICVTFLLSVMGLFLLYESSSYTALYYIGDRYFYVKYQLIWILLGIVLMFGISRFNYKKLYNFSLPLLIVSMALLFIVFLPGIGMKLKGAHRWVDLKLFVFQPSELLKISLTLYLAAWLSSKEKGRLVAFLALLFLSVAMVAIEPDMGTALIVGATSIIVYFLSGAKIKEMLLIFMLLIVGSALLIKMEPYRMSRLASFSDFNQSSIMDSSYHTRQILIALGSGGFSGVGFGKSIQKYAYLPENTTDSIFAIYSEESGLVGSIVLISIFFSLVFLGFLISIRTQNKFGKLLAGGIISFLGIQTFINLASQVVLVPLTGVPLPFVSYGGSSMLINFLSVGILLNISNQLGKV